MQTNWVFRYFSTLNKGTFKKFEINYETLDKERERMDRETDLRERD